MRQQLASFGAADYVLEQSKPGADQSALPGPTPIAEVVARIEAFRARREAQSEAAMLKRASLEPASHFQYQTDAEGVICDVNGVPPHSLIGLSIAQPAQDWLCGVDGHAAGAFLRRRMFADARMTVAGKGVVAGEWLITGTPLFDEGSGQFLGYRGSARRPLRHERARSEGEGALPAETGIRELIHELRTPLTAVIGFAEMIAQQMVGPVDAAYRAHARAIHSNGETLLHHIDALREAHILAQKNSVVTSFDMAALLTKVSHRFVADTDARKLRLVIESNAGATLVLCNREACEHLVDRLIAYLIASALPETEVRLFLQQREAKIILIAERQVSSMSEAEPSDAGPFALRLLALAAQAARVGFENQLWQLHIILHAAPAEQDFTPVVTPLGNDQRS
ncbi:MAG: hypothetical protein KGQ42_03330 [Alphaproteobacteria bacterium]|nr:hypothetical protein [Alphaproteobacteria bacterium]